MNVPKHVVQAVHEALRLLPPAMDSKEARVMLYAIGLQESRFTHRAQVIDGGGKGPARGYWQFERGGGVTGVLRHPASRFWANSVCNARNVPAQETSVWLAMETDDVLAAAAARLLLFTDPARLPAVGEQAESWTYYLRNWRPGKPHPRTWPECYETALKAVGEPTNFTSIETQQGG
jgi:hypothetical protein